MLPSSGLPPIKFNLTVIYLNNNKLQIYLYVVSYLNLLLPDYLLDYNTNNVKFNYNKPDCSNKRKVNRFYACLSNSLY